MPLTALRMKTDSVIKKCHGWQNKSPFVSCFGLLNTFCSSPYPCQFLLADPPISSLARQSRTLPYETTFIKTKNWHICSSFFISVAKNEVVLRANVSQFYIKNVQEYTSKYHCCEQHNWDHTSSREIKRLGNRKAKEKQTIEFHKQI